MHNLELNHLSKSYRPLILPSKIKLSKLAIFRNKLTPQENKSFDRCVSANAFYSH